MILWQPFLANLRRTDGYPGRTTLPPLPPLQHSRGQAAACPFWQNRRTRHYSSVCFVFSNSWCSCIIPTSLSAQILQFHFIHFLQMPEGEIEGDPPKPCSCLQIYLHSNLERYNHVQSKFAKPLQNAYYLSFVKLEMIWCTALRAKLVTGRQRLQFPFCHGHLLDDLGLVTLTPLPISQCCNEDKMEGWILNETLRFLVEKQD